MNKIFKVIWNHTTQTWTAVDELASVKGKSKSVKLAAISTALLVAASGVEAANVVSEAGELGQLSIATNKVTNQFFGNKRYQDETGLSNNVAGAKVNAYDGIAIGNGAVSGSPSGTGGNGHVAIGLMAQASAGGANGQNAAVALGAYSLATGQGGTAIGAHSVADALNSTALGKVAKANGDGSTAVGTSTRAEWQGTALGNTAEALGFYATSIGVNSKANSHSSTSIGKAAVVSGKNAIGVGTETKVNGEGTVAVGSGTNVSSKNVSTLGSNITVPAGRDGAVVLGHGSDAGKDTDVIAVHSAKIGDQSKLTYTGFAGDLGGTNNKGKNKPAASDKQGNFVSIGSEDNERQIKHVAAGRITADSTDALNGSQLYSVAKTLGNAAEGLADTLGVDLNEDGTVKNKFSQPLTVAEGSNYTAPPAAGDVKTALTNLNNYVNAGWNITASGNDYKNNVSVGHTVNFVGLGNVDVDGVNEENGVRTINISSDSPIDYATTKAEVDGNEVDVVKANDGKWYPKDKVDEDNNPKEGAAPIPSSEILKKGAKLTDSDTENNPYEKGNSYTYDKDGNITATGYDKTKPESKDEITAGKNGVQLNNVGWATQPDQAVNKDQLDQTVNKSGFYVQQNGKSTLDAKTDSDKVSDTEKVTPNDVVNFVNGNGTVIKAVTTRDANGVDTTNVTFNVDMAEITPESDGSVNGPVSQDLLDALDAAQAKVDENPDDEEAKKALEAAQDAVNKAGGNKVANAQNVADMINSSGFTLKTSATADGKKDDASTGDEIINPGKTVEMVAGKNLTVKQEANGKVTYSMKDDVEFTSVKVGEDKDGKKPVNFTTEKATDASNNDPANKPTTALNVSSSDGKPTQITGVGSTLNVKPVDTNTNGTPTADADKPKLVDLVGTDAAPVNKNAAATVGDLQNMGWVVSSDKATDATGEYKDVVKNANEVQFVGKNAAKVSGKTVNGVRTITVDVEAPSVETAKITKNTDGSVAAPVAADEAKKLADDLKKAEQAVKDLPADATEDKKAEAQKALKDAQAAAAPLNKVATAQNVADMINSSGFTLKTSATADGKKESGDDEIINPGKTVEMIAGKNLTVKQEANGKVTYATKDDVSFNTVNVGSDNTYVDADGKPVTKNADGTYTDSKGQPIEEGKVTKLAPVAMKAEKAKPATNNGNKAEDQPTTALNVSSSDGKPTQITGVGSTLNVKPVDTNTNGTPTAEAKRPNLVDLVGTDEAPVNKNAAATVGDLQNMGWVVSTEKGNGYKDVVKNANQVEFKGTGLATVTGETKDGIRTITVNVDAQKAVEAIQTPVVYTNKDGNKLVKVGDKFYKAGDVVNGKPQENAKAVPNGDVIASMSNGDNNTSKPMQLANVGSNLPTVNDTNKQAFDPNSTTPKAGKDNKSAPITAKEAADIVNKAGNNAATVSDVLNAGWNLQNNGEARDFVKPYDTVNFVNGKGTKAVVETADNLTSTVKFDVDAGEITADETKPGAVKGPNTTGKTPAELAKNLADAQKAVDDLAKDPSATEDAKQKAQDALKAAQDAAAPLNKVATAQNVADMINASGFTLKTSATADGKKDAASTGDEVINPGKAVEMVAGKNLTVKQEANGKVTYATKDDVQFNSVQLGGDNGPKLTNNGNDLKVSGSNGTPVKITNVADGNISADSKDAVNGGQLHATNQSINRLGDTVNNIGGNVTRLSDKVDNMDRDYRAGIAGSNAAASLPQVYLPGKSMVAAAAGTFKGQNALAVGYSSISDNGKLIWKAQANLNSRADVGVGVGMGYLW
ncbi:YadA-like family protein [Neisseria cinerea]|uniref:YadA-like family protein n=1 Tax=Neisseria cinerea TaxID=483 RepID=A0A7T3EUP8_NEICI|nr:YadA-like family protein [Neisseria cinerea]QPT38020.1 YadA-like family protein [Neisseria cinerea]SQF84193.1 adhesin [Neisseria cinerea]